MRLLYHFPPSPFSRRARLALAMKGLDVELRDARQNPDFLAEARARSALKTIPVFIDGDLAVGDSTTITHYLDRAYPTTPWLWPLDRDDTPAVLEVTTLVDAALDGLVGLGNRYYPLRENAAWPAIHAEVLSRAQRALDRLGDIAASLGRPTVAGAGWSAADIWLFTMTAWFEAIPERAKTTPIPAQILSLGWTLPPALSRWADLHRERADVRWL